MNKIEKEKKEEEFEKYIRGYNTASVLEYFSTKSLYEYQNGKQGFTIEGFPNGGNYGQWEFVQICYYAIKYSNDYRGICVNRPEFCNLINANKKHDEMMENIEKNISPQKLYEHLQCITNVQFDYQNLQTIRRFNRTYQIMISINRNIKYRQIDNVYINFEKEFKALVGIDIKKYMKIVHFIILLCGILTTTNIYEYVINMKINTEKLGFSKEDIIKVIQYESREYEFYREEKNNNWNILKYYPIVRTHKGENKYIISNVFSLALSLPNSVYWILRNHYKDIDSNKFTDYFGLCFEHYFNEILDTYNINYKKLKVSKKRKIKMPDWKIETDKYIFLIEQKASVFSIDARVTTKEERYNKIEEFFDRNIVYAFEQLNAYKPEDTNKTIIRICLTYEKIHMEETAKAILELRVGSTFNSIYNWIVNIDEMEILMSLLNSNINKFNNIVEEKIKLEKAVNRDGRNFEKLLHGITNDYIQNKINHFEDYNDEIRKNESNLNFN